MSSQKYGKLKFVEAENKDHEEGEKVESGYVWHCKLTKEECQVTSFSNGKPMCDRCPFAKDHKAKVKKGKQMFEALQKGKENG